MAFRISNNKILSDRIISHNPQNGLSVYNTIDQKLKQQLLNPLQQDVDGFRVYNTELQNALLYTIDITIFGSALIQVSEWISNNMSSQGDVIAFGSYYTVNGEVHVYEWNGLNWVPKGDPILGSTTNARTGSSVSLSSDGNILAVSSPDDTNSSNVKTGSVDVYEWNGSSWISKGDTIYGNNVNAQAGINSISLSSQGDIIAFGSPTDKNGSNVLTGSVDVYEWDGSAWVSKGSTIYGLLSGDMAGDSISLSSQGDVLAIGADKGSNSSNVKTGTVTVYEWNGSAWVPRGNIISGNIVNELVGSSVTLSSQGDVLAVGAVGSENASNDETGSVTVYDWNGSAWVSRGNTIYGVTQSQGLGESVDISSQGDVVAIASSQDLQENGTTSNSVSVYKWDGTSWNLTDTSYGGAGLDRGDVTLSSKGDVILFSNNKDLNDDGVQTGSVTLKQLLTY